MKESTGEVSMTLVTLVAIGVLGTILMLSWDKISARIEGLWDEAEDNARWGTGTSSGTTTE